MGDPIDDLAIEDLVTLVNEYADVTRHVADESMDNYPELTFSVANSASRAELLAVANDLHPVFTNPDRAIDRLNRMADANGLTHRLGRDGQLRWVRPTRSEPLACAAIAALIEVVNAHGPAVLGSCVGSKCVDVYIDTSQAQSRQYCSARCNNKARAARWRARRRITSAQNR